MASPDEIRAFVQQYGPMAATQAARLGTTPDNVLSQWALETGYGKSIIPGSNNLGNIKDVSGGGVAARDSQLGTVDKYRAYDSPQAGAQGYGDLMSRRYGNVAGITDPVAFGNKLAAGGYAEDKNYGQKIGGVAATLRKYADTMLSTLTGSTSAQAGELTPAQRAYQGAQGGPAFPAPPPPKPASAPAPAAGGAAPNDPWAAAAAKYSQPDSKPSADEADPWAAAAKKYGAPAAAPATAAPATAPPAAPGVPGGAAMPPSPVAAPAAPMPAAGAPPAPAPAPAFNLRDIKGSLQQGAGGNLYTGGPAFGVATLPTAPAPPTKPTERGLLGSFVNAAIHHMGSAGAGLQQKGAAAMDALGLGDAPTLNTIAGAPTSSQSLNDKITAREKFYQADQANNAGTFAGALVGDIAPALLMGPLASGGSTVLGAMGSGAAQSLMQPVLDAKSGKDVLKGAAVQAAIGAPLGAAGYGINKGVGTAADWAQNTFGSLREAAARRAALGTEAGQTAAATDLMAQSMNRNAPAASRIASNKGILGEAAPNTGPQLPGSPNAPTAANSFVVPESPIPGVQRSLAERTMNPEVAQLHRSVRDSVGTPFVEQEAKNAAARNRYFGETVGDAQTLAHAVENRTTATTGLFNQARDVVMPVDDHLQSMLDTPSGRNALATAQRNWADSPATRNLPFFGGTEDAPTLTGQALQHVKFALDDLADSALSSPNASTRRAAGGLREEFLQWAGDNNPIYAQANATFRNLSQRVNEQQYLQDAGLKATDVFDNVQAGRIRTILDRIAKDRQAGGITPSNDVSDEAVTRLQTLLHDLQIQQHAETLGKAKGSETAQKTVANYALANANPTARVAAKGLENAGTVAGAGLGGLLGPVGGMAGALVGKVVDAKTAESVLSSQRGLLEQLANQLTDPTQIGNVTRLAGQQATQRAAAPAAAAAAANAAPSLGVATTRALRRAGLLGLLSQAGRLGG